MASQQQATLLLEGPKSAWRAGGEDSSRLVDALPYFDKEYEDPVVRAQVTRLVQEEMRRGKKRPADFLKELPPVPPLQAERCPMFAREFERVRAGKPPASGVDQSRYEPKQVAPSRTNDPAAWKTLVQNACSHLQHLDTKRVNLELMQQFGANAWKVQNHHLEAFLARMQRQVGELKQKTELVNRDRKLNQQAAATELTRLNAQWADGIRKNLEIEKACAKLQEQIELLKAKASALGVDTRPQEGAEA